MRDVVAVGAAWLVERTDVPLHRAWRAVLVLPLAIPDFVVGYTWSSLSPAVHGLFGASLVMTLGLYPLVYLPVAAALRRADSSLYEVARSLGCGRLTALRRAVLPQIRAALLGGCLMVLLALLAEYGAFEILRFQTFTTEIFTEFNLGIDTAAASALALVLVVLSLLAVCGEMAAVSGVSIRPRQALHQAGPRCRGARHWGAVGTRGALPLRASPALGGWPCRWSTSRVTGRNTIDPGRGAADPAARRRRVHAHVQRVRRGGRDRGGVPRRVPRGAASGAAVPRVARQTWRLPGAGPAGGW